MTALKKTILVLGLILISCLNFSQAQEQKGEEQHQERTYTYQERELEYLMTIWKGEYDNVEQLDFDKALKKTTPQEGGHLRMHSFVERVDLPGFGDNVIYVEEYKDNNPNELSRQCLYELKPDEAAKAIRIKVHHFKTFNPRKSLKKNLDFLKDLNPDSALLEQGCDILMQREGMAFVGKTEVKNCIQDSSSPMLNLDYQIRVTENEYWFGVVKYDKGSAARLGDERQLSPYKLEKARCFACMIDFPKEKGGRPVVTKHYIKIHDQGGKFEFDYGDGRHMILGMRNTWSFGMQRETFVIFIQEGSQQGPTLIYSWGEPGADRIGFNPGWIRVQCDLDTPKNVKLQHGLRPGS